MLPTLTTFCGLRKVTEQNSHSLCLEGISLLGCLLSHLTHQMEAIILVPNKPFFSLGLRDLHRMASAERCGPASNNHLTYNMSDGV